MGPFKRRAGLQRPASCCRSVREDHAHGPLPAMAVSRLLAKTGRPPLPSLPHAVVVAALIHGYGHPSEHLDAGGLRVHVGTRSLPT